jgi:parallel beta-helix repeat protein
LRQPVKLNRETPMKRKLISAILTFQITISILAISNSEFFLPTSANNYDIIVEPGDSIQEAINNALEGQTIYIKKGEYILEGSRGIDVNKTVTLLGESVNETIIDGHGEITLIFGILANRAEIQNLTIRDSETYGFGIHIKDVTNVKIQNCHIENCGQGIRLTNSTNCELSRNLITNNTDYGICFPMDSSYNTIFWNNIKNNSYAISIALGCSENMFYQNNFVQNTFKPSGFGISANLWNITYPAGGNYWSDYTNNDVKKGPYQSETGSDGIGDKQYEILPGVNDSYPLMGPIHCFHAYHCESTDYYALVSSNISDAFPSNFYFDSNGAFINFTLTGNIEKGFCRVTIPNQLLWVEDGWIVTIDDEIAEHAFMSDINCTCICFAYNYSNTKTVKIQGTHCIPEFPSQIILIVAMGILITLAVLKRSQADNTPKWKWVPEVDSRRLKNYENTKHIGVNT